MQTVVSCSFGKDSIAAAITHIQHGGTVDLAVYCRIMYDNHTSAEMPEHEEWIHSVAIPKLERDWGIKTAVVQAPITYKGQFYRQYKRGQKAGGIYGFPFLKGSWCNSKLKVEVVEAYKKQVGDHKEIIGLAIDEGRRMPGKRKDPRVILPLVEHQITQKQSMEIARNAGLLSPAYGGGHRD